MHCVLERCRKNPIRWALISLAALFFLATSLYAVTFWLPQALAHSPLLHNSPDAMANQYFIQYFKDYTSINAPVFYQDVLGNVVHPRSVNIVGSTMVPMSFTGMIILYGLLAKIVGNLGILLVTPLVAALALFLFYKLTRRLLHNRNHALLATGLLACLAPWVYYTTVSMYHTIPFIVLVLLSFYLITVPSSAFRFPWSKQTRDWRLLSLVAGGVALGLSLWVRPVELPWLMLWLGYFCWLAPKTTRLRDSLLVVSGLIIGLIPMFSTNVVVYGHWWEFGYMNFDRAGGVFDRLPAEFTTTRIQNVLHAITAIVLPFGWHIKTLLKSSFIMFVYLYGVHLVLSVVGLVTYLRKGEKSAVMTGYVVVTLLTAVWLVLYYGNWEFADSDTLRYTIIGSSYARYYLPIFIALLPGVVYGLHALVQWVKPRWQQPVMAGIIVVLVSSSLWWAYMPERDGLFATLRNMQSYSQDFHQVQKMIPANAILIVDTADKIFFPQFSVVVFRLDYAIFTPLSRVVNTYPVYYYSAMPDKDIDFINRVKIKDLRLEFNSPQRVNEQFRLWQLNSIP